jgi:hemerythrin superfamily protein
MTESLMQHSQPTTVAKARASRTDAVAILKADHRQVERWFKDFDTTSLNNRKHELAANICKALRIHTVLEEEIFYPAFLQATGDETAHHEAIVEHAGALKLIEEIEQSPAIDGFFSARVHVLSEMIKHHVKQEEKPAGMFAQARKTDMDLEDLGRKMLRRRQDLNGERGKVEKAQAAA